MSTEILGHTLDEWKPEPINEGPPFPIWIDKYLPNKGLWPWYHPGGSEAGILSGNVKDGSGNALSGVSISLSGIVSGQTDISGNYSIGNITPGNYSITFSKDGYQNKTY
jgi:hypothetical protein